MKALMLRCLLLRSALLLTFYLPLWEVGVTAQDGTLLWQFPVGGSMTKCPAIDENGVVYISAPDNNVHALNGETGEVLWSYPTELGASTAPVLGPDGAVYVGLSETNIVALNGETGELLWETPSGGVTTVLGLSDGGALFGHGGYGLLISLDGSDGAVRWETKLDLLQPSSGLALNADGTVLLAARGRLLAIDDETGDVLLEYVTDGNSIGALYPVPAADGTVFFGSWTRGFYAFDMFSGSPRWRLHTGERWDSPSVIGPEGTVYACTGTLYAINAATGRLNWSFTSGERLLFGPAISVDGTLYVGGDSGGLYAIDADSGAERWRFARSERMAGHPTIGPTGTIYIACRDGNLYALEGSAPLAQSPWPKWQQDLGNTGQSRWMEGSAEVLGQSGDERAVEGSTVRLWINAKGTPPFTYQWYRDGEQIPDATANYLVLPYFGSEDEGSYHAVVYNELGTASSEPVALSVGYSLAVDWYPVLGTVTGVPEAAVVLPGTEVTLEAQGAEGHEFVGWEGDVQSAENPLTLQVTRNLRLRARFAAEPGTVLWVHDAGGRVEGSPAIGPDGTVYFGADYRLQAVEGNSGTLKWQTSAAWGQHTPTPVVGPEGLVYGSDPNRVMAYEAGTGQWTWELEGFSSLQYVPTPVTIDYNGTVYHSDDNRKLRAMNGLTGDVLWETQMADNASPPAVGVDGRLYVSTYGGDIQSFDQSDGSELWSVESGAQASHTPALDGLGNLFAAAGLGSPRDVTRVNTTSGERLWSTHLSTYFSSPTLGLNGTVLVQTGSGAFCLSQADGEILWSIPEAQTEDCSPATASDGTVYIGSNDGLFRAVNGQTGEIIWTNQTGGAIRVSPNIGPDGTVYIGSNDGKLYAIASSAPLADTPWPKYQADMQNTGRVNAPPVVPVEVQLLGVGLREDSAFVFEVQGPASAELLLQESENLRDWSDADTVVLDESGRVTVVNDAPASDTARFYRIRVAP